MAASAIFVVLLLVWPQATEFLAPGPLSNGHGQILGSTVATERCGVCHPGAKDSAAKWFVSTFTAGHSGVTQTDLCLNCHHTRMPRNTARNPHGIDDSRLVAITQSLIDRGLADPHRLKSRNLFSEGLACATCHREHHGMDPSLTQLGDAQCQTCHIQTFNSLAKGHPDWDRWPYGRQGQIHFDHRSHQQKHFTAKQQSFDCKVCHTVNPQGELGRSVGYDIACASCHDASLKEQSSSGFALLQFPTVDVEALTASNLKTPEWPQAAQGFNELQLPPLMRLLLLADPAMTHIDPVNLKSHKPEEIIALMSAIRRLSDELIDQGQPPISRRLLDIGVAPTQVKYLSETFPLQIVLNAPWWPTSETIRTAKQAHQIRRTQFQESDLLIPDPKDALPTEALSDDDPLLDAKPNATIDPLADNLEAQNPKLQSKSIQEQLSGGGWYRDDTTLAVRYLPTGHSDPKLRALVELSLDRASNDNRNATVVSTLEEIERTSVVQSCLKCHEPVRNGESWNWRAIGMDQRGRGFTKFSHRPHLHQPMLDDCTHCHTIGKMHEVSAIGDSFVSQSESITPGHEFEPLSRAACVNCHQKGAAGDHCTQCHRYHVD